MKFRAHFLFLSALTFLILSIPDAHAQSILNQSGDDLLKDFDVDPNQVASQYQQKPVGKAQAFLQMLSAAMSRGDSNNNNKTVSDDKSTLRLRAPFVKFDMANGQRCVRVNAPFVSYDSNPRMSADLNNQESAVAPSQTAPPAASSIGTAFPDIPSSTAETASSSEPVTSAPAPPATKGTTGGAVSESQFAQKKSIKKSDSMTRK
jgi:hypothetical protein